LLIDQQCGKTKGFKKPFVSQSTSNQNNLSFAGAFCGQLSTNSIVLSFAAFIQIFHLAVWNAAVQN
jgi:hypothetical protein